MPHEVSRNYFMVLATVMSTFQKGVFILNMFHVSALYVVDWVPISGNLYQLFKYSQRNCIPEVKKESNLIVEFSTPY